VLGWRSSGRPVHLAAPYLSNSRRAYIYACLTVEFPTYFIPVAGIPTGRLLYRVPPDCSFAFHAVTNRRTFGSGARDAERVAAALRGSAAVDLLRTAVALPHHRFVTPTALHLTAPAPPPPPPPRATSISITPLACGFVRTKRLLLPLAELTLHGATCCGVSLATLPWRSCAHFLPRLLLPAFYPAAPPLRLRRYAAHAARSLNGRAWPFYTGHGCAGRVLVAGRCYTFVRFAFARQLPQRCQQACGITAPDDNSPLFGTPLWRRKNTRTPSIATPPGGLPWHHSIYHRPWFIAGHCYRRSAALNTYKTTVRSRWLVDIL